MIFSGNPPSLQVILDPLRDSLSTKARVEEACDILT